MIRPSGRDALDRGLLRYCPICDGYEATGQALGVIGADSHGVAEALFLRTYSDDVTLIAHEAVTLTDADRALLASAKVGVVESPLDTIGFAEKAVVRLQDGTERHFDTVYPALGSDSRNALARHVAAQRPARVRWSGREGMSGSRDRLRQNGSG